VILLVDINRTITIIRGKAVCLLCIGRDAQWRATRGISSIEDWTSLTSAHPTEVHKEVLYILAYKLQNFWENLDLKVGGATYMRVIKQRIVLQPTKYAVSGRVEPPDSVLLCDVLPLGRGTYHRLLPVVHCQFTVAYLHALYSLLLIDRMVSVMHQQSHRRHRRPPPPRGVACDDAVDGGHAYIWIVGLCWVYY